MRDGVANGTLCRLIVLTISWTKFMQRILHFVHTPGLCKMKCETKLNKNLSVTKKALEKNICTWIRLWNNWHVQYWLEKLEESLAYFKRSLTSNNLIKSEILGGHAISELLETIETPSFSRNISIVTSVVWHLTPSCWNQMVSGATCSNFRYKNLLIIDQHCS